jgi:hypothetical protein
MASDPPPDNRALGEAFTALVNAWGAMNPHRQFAQGEYDPEALAAAEQQAQADLDAILEARKPKAES